MKKLVLILALCLTGISTSYLSAKTSLEINEKEITIGEEKIDVDCVSYAFGVMDTMESLLGEITSPNDYNMLFNRAEAICERHYN